MCFKMQHVPTGTTFPLVDRLLDGRLAEILTSWRAEGLSYETMARRLEADHDVTVSIATVYRWCDAIADDQPKGAA